jgi:hypothetical protein
VCAQPFFYGRNRLLLDAASNLIRPAGVDWWKLKRPIVVVFGSSDAHGLSGAGPGRQACKESAFRGAKSLWPSSSSIVASPRLALAPRPPPPGFGNFLLRRSGRQEDCCFCCRRREEAALVVVVVRRRRLWFEARSFAAFPLPPDLMVVLHLGTTAHGRRWRSRRRRQSKG